MSEYEKLFVSTPRPLELTHYRLPKEIRQSVAWMDSSVVPGACNMEVVMYKQPLEGPARHVHDDTGEVLGFFGTDPEDPTDLGGEVHFWFGDEVVKITKSGMFYIPPNLEHGPFQVVRVDRPIMHFVITPERKFSHAKTAAGLDAPGK